MSSLLLCFKPNKHASPKADGAVRIGLLGASKVSPSTVIAPARSHREVIIAAVAARDQKRAHAYAKKHGIPKVHVSYQELINDPEIDAVYIPLPNGLHYEWALKSLQAGKHVLLEKPSVSNSAEAESLFRLPLLSEPNAPVLLEALHVRYHPAFRKFLSLLDPANIEHASAKFVLPPGIVPNDDICYNYDMSGGACLNLGSYMILPLVKMLGEAPTRCVEAKARPLPKGREPRIDQAMEARFEFPNGATGEILADLSGKLSSWFWFLWRGAGNGTPQAYARHREVVAPGDEQKKGQEHVLVKTVTLSGFIFPMTWPPIDIQTQHTIRDAITKKTIKTWTEHERVKKYVPDAASQKEGEEKWSTYRHQLEAFVDRIKGRQGSGVWVDGETSITQAKIIDEVYQKAGLPIRPSKTLA